MKVLAINCGSSTLKFDVIDTINECVDIRQWHRIASGIVDNIGRLGSVHFVDVTSDCHDLNIAIADHREAVQYMFDWLKTKNLMQPGIIRAVGHRVVHGGDQFNKPTIIEDEILNRIDEISYLAPLHNIPALAAIRATRDIVSQSIPMVAVFDTSFHQSMPERAAIYAIEYDLTKKHNIRRYGFHGLAHSYMVDRYSYLCSKSIENAKIITVQLGNGCSVTAVDKGRSVDTSMGLTPLEGLIMGTRSGDVDPSMIKYLCRCEKVDVDEAENILNRKSGLLGISGVSHDMRELLLAETNGNQRASLAISMFCYRIQKYIGAYLTVLGGANAIIFGGGIGGNSAIIRARICEAMEWCGISINEERNISVVNSEGLISNDNSKTKIYVVPVDEAKVIVRDTVECMRLDNKFK